MSEDRVLAAPVPPDYDHDNPLDALVGVLEQTRFAASREVYPPATLQHLLTIDSLDLWGPDPTRTGGPPDPQDDKEDFQKQNLAGFRLAATRAVRGWAVVGGGSSPEVTFPFVQLSYRAGPDTPLAGRAVLGDAVWVTVTVGGTTASLRAPYDVDAERYVVEIWGIDGDLVPVLDARGRAALALGTVQQRTDLLAGGPDLFTREALGGRDVRTVAPGHALHPVLPWYADVVWRAGEPVDAPADPVVRVGFEMPVRGWDNYLSVGTSANPHGGRGVLEYRNLFSTYFAFKDSDELGAPGRSSFVVSYADLHLLAPGSSIGLHRHRDNSEVFHALDGEVVVVTGDWRASGTRDRAFEVRTLAPGSMAMVRGGNLHAALNPADRPAQLLTMGGYD